MEKKLVLFSCFQTRRQTKMTIFLVQQGPRAPLLLRSAVPLGCCRLNSAYICKFIRQVTRDTWSSHRLVAGLFFCCNLSLPVLPADLPQTSCILAIFSSVCTKMKPTPSPGVAQGQLTGAPPCPRSQEFGAAFCYSPRSTYLLACHADPPTPRPLLPVETSL